MIKRRIFTKHILATKFGVALLISTIVATAGLIGIVHAARTYDDVCVSSTGLRCWEGFFTLIDGAQGGSDVIGGGLAANNADDMVNALGSMLQCVNGSPAGGQNSTGAAFIIVNMLGYGAGSPKSIACSQFGEWSNRVHAYAAAGQVNWDTGFTYTINSYYLSGIDDDAYYSPGYSSLVAQTDPDSIVFYNTDGSIAYAIRRACGNPLGHFGGLQPLPWSLTGNVTPSTTDVYPGESVKFDYSYRNDGPGVANYTYSANYMYNNGPWTPVSFASDPGQAPGAVNWLSANVTVPNNGANQLCGYADVWWSHSWAADLGRWSSCVTVNQPIGTCSGYTLTPSQIMPGQSFTIDSSVSYQDDRAAISARNNGSNYTVRVVRVNGAVETQVFQQTSVPTSLNNNFLVGNTVTVPASAITVAGQYRVYYGNYGSLGNVVCGAGTSFDAAYYPYFNSVGGDIVAGAGFTQGMACTDTAGAGIKGWNNGGPFYGAGSQLAALAIGDIKGFASGVNSVDGSSSTASPPGIAGAGNNLTFSNVGVSGRLGNTALPCMPDYYTNTVSKATAVGAAAIPRPALESMADGSYSKYTGNISVGSGALPMTINGDGRQVTVLVDGNLYIKGNITYGPYPDPKKVPRLTFIVRGNIYVDAGVTELHGIYIAQGQGVAGKGNVYTCSNGFAALSDYSACNRPLTFYGAVAAESITLGRTYGNLIAVGGTPNAAAESFVYTPETWLAKGGLSSDPGLPAYDAITSLPPTL